MYVRKAGNGAQLHMMADASAARRPVFTIPGPYVSPDRLREMAQALFDYATQLEARREVTP